MDSSSKENNTTSAADTLTATRTDRDRSCSCPSEDCEFSPAFDEGDEYYKGTLAKVAVHEACMQCENMKQANNLCRYCQHLHIYHFLVCIPDSGRSQDCYPISIRWHTIRDIYVRARSECLMCRQVLRAVRLWAHSYGEEWEQRISQSENGTGTALRVQLIIGTEYIIGGTVMGIHVPAIVIHLEEDGSKSLGNSRQGSLKSFGVIAKASGPEFDPANLVRAKVSFDTIRRHLTACEEKEKHDQAPTPPVVESREIHGKKCTPASGPKRPGLPPGSYLVDVEEYCITEPPPDCQYIALSYVWGKPIPGRVELQLLQSNIKEMTIRGYLREKLVPATIQDAMTVCSKLGIRYLWVDRLCIIQDGDAHKQSQINAMGTIYSSAYLTICAVGSPDSDMGLFGVGKQTRPFTQQIETVAGVQQVLIFPPIRSYDSAKSQQVWWKRAWTYQEYQLSKRRLYFGSWKSELNCSTCYKSYSEGYTCGAVDDTSLPTNWPIKGYGQALGHFNVRDCTDDADILNAIRGVFEHLYENLDLFHYGLPTVDFDEALLWTNTGQSRPRASQNGFEFPSWTWARAKGTVQFSTAFYGPLVQWHRWMGKDGFLPIIASRSMQLRGWDSYHWMNEFHPSLCLAAAWHLNCIESTAPSAVSAISTSEFEVLEPELQKRWPEYSDFLDEAFPDQRSIYMEDLPRTGYNEDLSTILAGRTTTAELLMTNRLQGQFAYYLANKVDGRLVGALQPDRDKAGIKPGVWRFIALSVARMVEHDLLDLLREDKCPGSSGFG